MKQQPPRLGPVEHRSAQPAVKALPTRPFLFLHPHLHPGSFR